MVTFNVKLIYSVRVQAYSKTDAELRALEVLERNTKEARLVETEVKEESIS